MAAIYAGRLSLVDFSYIGCWGIKSTVIINE